MHQDKLFGHHSSRTGKIPCVINYVENLNSEPLGELAEQSHGVHAWGSHDRDSWCNEAPPLPSAQQLLQERQLCLCSSLMPAVKWVLPQEQGTGDRAGLVSLWVCVPVAQPALGW